jgi:putative flippase GtrA
VGEPGAPPRSATLGRALDRPVASIPTPWARFRARVVVALRSGSNWVQLAKFCTVGVVGYGVNLAVYAAILHQGVHYLAAATCSFLVAVTNNYAWNRVWTFRDRRAGVAAQGARFFVVSVASLGANLVFLHVLVTLGAGKLFAQAVAIVLVTPLNFVGNKLWSFRLRS